MQCRHLFFRHCPKEVRKPAILLHTQEKSSLCTKNYSLVKNIPIHLIIVSMTHWSIIHSRFLLRFIEPKYLNLLLYRLGIVNKQMASRSFLKNVNTSCKLILAKLLLTDPFILKTSLYYKNTELANDVTSDDQSVFTYCTIKVFHIAYIM